MASKSSGSSKSSSKSGAKVLGRSAATGKYVMAPAAKSSSASMKAANTAVKGALQKKD